MDLKFIEDIFSRLWEKINLAGERLKILEKENQKLEQISQSLKSENELLRNNLIAKDQEIKKLKLEMSQRSSTNQGVTFSNVEKDILKDRIRDLIAKINSHL